MEKVCVVIPIHSSDPTPNELVSFKQCFKILGSHPIFIVVPENLDLVSYRAVVPVFNVVYINPKWQSSILNYNKLKLSRYFYSLFADYEYLLTYELDAFVFKDELLYWCSKGYDYIGAPWFEGYTNSTKNIIGVGNSGFSLRKIEKISANLKNILYNEPFCGHKRFYLNRFNRFIQKKIGVLFKENLSLQKSNILYEDRVICDIIKQIDKSFKIASIEDSIKFSFEINPNYLFETSGNNLPFGCHAWEKYEFEFWKPHIFKFFKNN